jgi:hypothetical protein
MEIVYLDYNCFQRGLDDPGQVRIQMEALACQEVLIRKPHMGRTKMMGDAEIRITGIEALNKALGPAAALRFLTLLHRDPTDYVEISRRLYEGQSVYEIFARARKHWDKPPHETRGDANSAHRTHKE